MTNVTKIAIGIGVLAVGYYLWQQNIAPLLPMSASASAAPASTTTTPVTTTTSAMPVVASVPVTVVPTPPTNNTIFAV